MARVTLNRAEIHNAFDEVLIRRLTETFQELAGDKAVRLVVLQANGRSFSAGADLDWMKRSAEYAFDENLTEARRLAEMIRRLDTLPMPTIALVQGAAIGGGVGLVAACDIALAADAAVFSFSEVKLGIIPSVISPYVLRAIGERAAGRYVLTGERFDAAEALRIGLVHAVVPADGLDSASEALTNTILANGPEAVAAAKRLIADIAGQPIDGALIEETARRIAEIRRGAEGREGVGAFLEKRKPNWL
ncbi:MAG: enoyl-CoA hydratase/isomerase family protein [Rhodospirillales bacterium]|nr:enoyl-CoA hydratase/isomerase family protein [Rhodospirillales bacterium]